MQIRTQNITKNFGKFTALDNINLDVKDGEILALLGPSGSGKTTLLRLIAGLDFPTSGDIMFNGDNVVNRSVRDRRVGLVFQHYALFGHMTIFSNVAFGLRVKPKKERMSKKEIHERVMELLRLVHLEQFANRYPNQLSGGQRQRVALARALAIEPEILLLDEPFGALDAKVRKELRKWLKHLHEQLKFTCIFVTHDQEEALELADRLVVMRESKIAQIGTSREVYDYPASPFVYEFLGNANRFSCYLKNGVVKLANQRFFAVDYENVDEKPAIAFVRPHDVIINKDASADGLKAVVKQVIITGPSVEVELELKDTKQILVADKTRLRHEKLALEYGQEVSLSLRNLRIFLDEGEMEFSTEENV